MQRKKGILSVLSMVLGLVWMVVPVVAQQCAWSALGRGTSQGFNPDVNAMAGFDDGAGPVLYAGGFFGVAGCVLANHISKWDGTQWYPFCDGTGGAGTSGQVLAFLVFDDGAGPALYIAGNFTSVEGVPANNIAKWDGKQWSALGLGTNGRTASLAVFDDGSGPALYAGGRFNMAGGAPANFIAKWNGKQWSALSSGVDQPDVNALRVFDDGTGEALYVGGGFLQAGGVAANRIAKWNGTQWSAVGLGMDQSLYDLTVFNDGTGPALYAAGIFSFAGGMPANHIAKWNGTQWSALGSGVNANAHKLVVFNDGTGPALYAGGNFTIAGGVPVSLIAKWNGTQWSALVGSGVNDSVFSLAVFDDGTGTALYVGGRFNMAGGVPASGIAKYRCTTP